MSRGEDAGWVDFVGILTDFVDFSLPRQVKAPKETPKTNKEEMKDQGSRHGTLNSPITIMSTGGCKSPMGYHPNGQEWHPVIASHGEFG
jgi:hypothetical protein